MSTQNNQLAFVFPGQGSQSVGMLVEMAESYPEIKDTFAQASEVLGLDLWFAATIARSIAALFPAITTCPGELKLTAEHTSP
jgi:malonyl CoA-acyl carrier protein transacylase